MSGKAQRPPEGESWTWLTRNLVASDAWRSRSVNAGRLIDFLLIEHMAHGGAENGKLKAPQHQLEAFGIGSRYISAAISQAEELGLIDCHRHGMKVVSTYTLNWLPNHDGSAPSNRWRSYRSSSLRPMPKQKFRNLPLKGKVGLPLKGKVDDPNVPLKEKVDDPKNLPLKGKDLSRCSYQGSGYNTDVSGDGLDGDDADYALVVAHDPDDGVVS